MFSKHGWTLCAKVNKRAPREKVHRCSCSMEKGSESPWTILSPASDGGKMGAAEGWLLWNESMLSTVKRISSLSSGRGWWVSVCLSGMTDLSCPFQGSEQSPEGHLTATVNLFSFVDHVIHICDHFKYNFTPYFWRLTIWKCYPHLFDSLHPPLFFQTSQPAPLSANHS